MFMLLTAKRIATAPRVANVHGFALLRGYSASGRFPKGTTIKSDPSKYTTFDFPAAKPSSSAYEANDSDVDDDIPEEAVDLPPIARGQSKYAKKTASPSSTQERLEQTSTSSKVPLLRVNEDITGVKEARLIDGETGETISVLMSFADCQAEAEKRSLDLIEVSKIPPVLKIADFNKIIEQRKEQRKKVQSMMGFKPSTEVSGLEEIKEIHMGTNIENHDFEMKRELIKKFLLKKHPIKLVLKFKKSAHLKMDERPARARQLVERLQTDLREYIAPEDTKQKAKDLQGTIIKVFFPMIEGVTNKPAGGKPPKQPKQPKPPTTT